MHVEHIDSEFYKSRLENALKMSAVAPAAALTEVAHILELLLIEAASALNLGDLERQLRDATNLDLESIREVAAKVRGLKPKVMTLKDGETIDPEQEVRGIDEALKGLSQQHVLASNVAWFHLEFQVDGHLTRLLICAAHSGLDLDFAVAKAREKLSRLDALSLVRLWGHVQREFDEGRQSRFDPDSPLLPPKFLELTSSEDLRRKIADYAFRVKPALLAARIANEVYSHPMDALGPARLLAINGSSTPLEHNVLRLDLARAIGRLSATWTTLLNGKLQALATLVGLEPETRLLQGPDAKAAQNELSQAATPAAAAAHEALAFLMSIARLGAARSGIEGVLSRHKLGLEISLPGSAREVRGGSELLLQKKLGRFLIEQGIYAEGTKFGPFETDLLANVRAIATVLEVKLYGRTKRPTVNSLRSNLAQLQDYMDKRPVRPTGALVVYNLSNTLVVAPNRWIRGKYWICVINLGSHTGSHRRSTLTIDEGSGDELIIGVSNDAATNSRPKRKGGRSLPKRRKKTIRR